MRLFPNHFPQHYVTTFSEILRIALSLRIKLALDNFKLMPWMFREVLLIYEAVWMYLCSSRHCSFVLCRWHHAVCLRIFKYMGLTFGEITSLYRRSEHVTCTDGSVEGLSAELIAGVWLRLVLGFNPLNAELNPICHLLALLGGATVVVVSRLRVKG